MDVSKAIILDKVSPELEDVVTKTTPIVNFAKDGTISFNGQAAELFNMQVGKYVKFVHLPPAVFGFIVTDDVTGYKLSAKAERAGVRTSSRNIRDYMGEKFNTTFPRSYTLQARENVTIKGSMFIELLMHIKVNRKRKK